MVLQKGLCGVTNRLVRCYKLAWMMLTKGLCGVTKGLVLCQRGSCVVFLRGLYVWCYKEALMVIQRGL